MMGMGWLSKIGEKGLGELGGKGRMARVCEKERLEWSVWDG